MVNLNDDMNSKILDKIQEIRGNRIKAGFFNVMIQDIRYMGQLIEKKVIR